MASASASVVEPQDLLAQLGIAIDELQPSQDRNDLVSTLKVQLDLQDGDRTQARPGIDRKTHAVSSVKIAADPLPICGFPHADDPLALDLREEFHKMAREIGGCAFSDRL